MHAPNLCTVGQSLEGCEVVWNGAIERQVAASQWRPAPPLVEAPTQRRFVDARPAQMDSASPRACDRVVGFLLANPHAEHTPLSVSEALRLENNTVSITLQRLCKRGMVQVVGRGTGKLARQRIYAVRRNAMEALQQARADGRARMVAAIEARPDATSARVCDRLLAYVMSHPQREHTAPGVAARFGVTPDYALTYLRRFERRGLLRHAPGGIYRVKEAA